jgi:peptidoglycan hydrolase CwlO-like protein
MSLLLKPKIIQDITRPSRESVFRPPSNRVNLSYTRVFRIPATKIAKSLVVAAAGMFLAFGSVTAPTTTSSASSATSTSPQAPEERAALEAQLQDLENQINQYETQITGYQKQGKSLKGDITSLNDKIAKLNLQIKAINLTLTQLDRNITETQFQIASTEESIQSNQDALGTLIRGMYQSDQASLMEILFKSPTLSDFFNDVNNNATLQDNLHVTINRISDLEGQLKDHKDQLSLAKADAQTVKQYQANQEQQANVVKAQKNTLLTVTKGQESKYQQLLATTKKTAADIRNRIFELLGGGELTFEQAYQYALVAGNATGVKPSLILAVLDRESALGKNVGKCSYQTAMSPSNQPLFLQITAELNLNPDSMMVSCANADGAYGGAMGPAQFIPSTWLLYKPVIESTTGRAPASPWNNADAFMATALYMKDAGAAGATTPDTERAAAAKYYAGGNWKRYLWTYGEAVVSRAAQFDDDIAQITG